MERGEDIPALVYEVRPTVGWHFLEFDASIVFREVGEIGMRDIREHKSMHLSMFPSFQVHPSLLLSTWLL